MLEFSKTDRSRPVAAFAFALVVLVAIAASPTADANVARKLQFEGTYVPLHFEGGPRRGDETQWLQTTTGMIRLDLRGVGIPRPGARIAVDGVASTDGIEVSSLETVAAPQLPAPPTGTVNALVIQLGWGTSVPA